MTHNYMKKYSVYQRAVNLFLPSTSLLDTYGWGKFDFTFIGIIILVGFGICNKKLSLKIPRLLKIYLMYYLCTIVLSITSFVDLIPLGWLRIYLSCGMFFTIIDYPLLLRYYRRIAIACLIFLGFQVMFDAFTGIKVLGTLEFLPFALDMDKADYLIHVSSQNARFSSFFSEPAHFVQFLLPLLAIILFKKKERKDWLLLIAIIIALFLMKSGNAIFGVSTIIVCFFTWKIKNLSFLKKLYFSIFFTSLLVSGGYYYLSTTDGEQLLKRSDQLSGDSEAESGHSGFIRIFRGYYVFDELSPLRKIIGVNNADLIRQAINKSKVRYFFKENDLYFNVTQPALIRSGIIGTILLFAFYFALFKRGNIAGKTIISILFVLGFMSSLFFTETMIFYLILAYNNHTKVNDNRFISYEKNHACIRNATRGYQDGSIGKGVSEIS